MVKELIDRKSHTDISGLNSRRTIAFLYSQKHNVTGIALDGVGVSKAF